MRPGVATGKTGLLGKWAEGDDEDPSGHVGQLQTSVAITPLSGGVILKQQIGAFALGQERQEGFPWRR